MDTPTLLLGGIIGIVTALITAYVTNLFNLRQESAKWRRDLGEKLVELKSSNPLHAKQLARQYAIGYFIITESPSSPEMKVFIPPVGRLSVGRFSDNDIILSDASVSRHHAVFTVVKSTIFVDDMGSWSGTVINGEIIARGEPRPVQNGDVVRIGRICIIFHELHEGEYHTRASEPSSSSTDID